MKWIIARLKYWWEEHREDVLEPIWILLLPIWIIPLIIICIIGDDRLSAHEELWLISHDIEFDKSETTRSDFKRLRKEYKKKRIAEIYSGNTKDNNLHKDD